MWMKSPLLLLCSDIQPESLLVQAISDLPFVEEIPPKFSLASVPYNQTLKAICTEAADAQCPRHTSLYHYT